MQQTLGGLVQVDVLKINILKAFFCIVDKFHLSTIHNNTKFMKNLFILFCLFFSLYSCSNENSLCVFDVENITEYKDEANVKPDTTFTVNEMYVNRFKIIDSLIIFETKDKEKAWKISKVNNIHPITGMFNQGRSSKEFVWIPNVRRSQFFYQNKDLYAVVYDFGNGKVYKSKVMNEECDSSIEEIKNIKVEPNLDNYIYISDNEYMYRRNTYEAKAKQLIWIKNGRKRNCKSIEKLNQIEVPAEDYNSLAAYTHYSVEHNVLIQAYKYFNIINIIDLNEDKGKCICLGEKTISDSSVILNRRRKCFCDDMRIYKNFFVILSQDGEKSFLCFFDYDGNPIKKVNLDSIVDSFDIDFYGNRVFTYNSETTVFKAYTI